MKADDFRARFLPRFAAVARKRLENAEALIARADPAKAGMLAAEMHALAGEAAILGLTEVADAAHEAEIAAEGWLRSGVAEGAAACQKSLDSLRIRIGSFLDEYGGRT